MMSTTMDPHRRLQIAFPSHDPVEIQKEILICKQRDFNPACERAWVIDADDTLWEDNLYYEKLIGELSDHIRVFVPEAKHADFRELLDATEHEIIPQMGFGPIGFDRSIRLAFERFCASNGYEVPYPSEFFDRVIPTLSAVPYEVSDDVRIALVGLRERGEGLVLFTQGPIDIQIGKIERSGLESSFGAISITSSKSTDHYRYLIDALFPSNPRIVVVGNSLNSEVRPALQCGFDAVHYINPNSWHAVNNSSVDPSQYVEVRSLTDLLTL